MFFIRHLIALPRRRPRLAALYTIAMVWIGWFLWPPQPDFRYEGPPGYIAAVSRDGQRATFFDRSSGDGVPTSYRATVVDIPTGRITTASYTAICPHVQVAPDGEQVVIESDETRRELRSWPAAERICTLPEGDWSTHWSPDGRHVALSKKSKLIIIRTTSGEVVSKVEHGESEPEFLPDGSGICLLSVDGSRLEVWGFDPFRVLDSCVLHHSPDKQARSNDRPIFGSFRVKEIQVSKDGRRVIARALRLQSVAGEPRVVDSVVMWDRLSGKCVAFDTGGHHPISQPSLSMSPCGQTIGFTPHKVTLGDGIDIPMLQAERKASTYSKASAWLIDNDKAIEVRMPLKTEVVMPCGRYLVCHGVRQLWIVDGRSGMVIANMPGSVKGQYHFPGSDIGYMAVNSDMPGWLPVWLRDFYSWYHPEGTGESRIVRVNDGSVSRIIPYRRQPWFDDEGNLWTTNPTAAGGEAIERWSPESPHPWWLYAVAAAGVGYLIWPALVRLTSRWRQTRPAAIAV